MPLVVVGSIETSHATPAGEGGSVLAVYAARYESLPMLPQDAIRHEKIMRVYHNLVGDKLVHATGEKLAVREAEGVSAGVQSTRSAELPLHTTLLGRDFSFIVFLSTVHKNQVVVGMHDPP